jgi:hypothetical protein
VGQGRRRSTGRRDDRAAEGRDQRDSGPAAAREEEVVTYSLDEFIGGEERSPSLFEADIPKELALPAFSLLRGGDLFLSNKKPPATESALVDRYAGEKLKLHAKRIAKPEQDGAFEGVLRVVRGNPALCRRMLQAKPIDVVIVPKGRDFRELGFPANTNPDAAGIFWTSTKEVRARLGLREEEILARPHLMIHEMTHAVHFLAFSQKEREDIDRALLPVYLNRRWVEEAVAIYAEKTFGAIYNEGELRAPGLYGKTRRDWNDKHVFALFMKELMRPR